MTTDVSLFIELLKFLWALFLYGAYTVIIVFLIAIFATSKKDVKELKEYNKVIYVTGVFIIVMYIINLMLM